MWKRLALAFVPSIAAAASLLVDPETALAQAVKPRFTLILDTSSSMVENTSRHRHLRRRVARLRGLRPGQQRGDLPLRRQPPVSGQGRHRRHHRRVRLGGVHAGPVPRRRPRPGLHHRPPSARPSPPAPPAWAASAPAPRTTTPARTMAPATPARSLRPRCRSPMNNRILFRSTACRGAAPASTPPARRARCWCPSRAPAARTTPRCSGWMNGTEGTPPFAGGVNPDPELRADLGTPLASSLDSIREWLTTASSSVGPDSGAAGPRARPDRHPRQLPPVQRHPADRRPGVVRRRSASRRHRPCARPAPTAAPGTWPTCAARSAAVPTNTSNVKVYVIGFGVGAGLQADLNAIAAAGGTGHGVFPGQPRRADRLAGGHRGPVAARAPLRLRRHLRRRGRRLPRQGHDLHGRRRPLQARGRVRLQRRRRRHRLFLHRRGDLPGHPAGAGHAGDGGVWRRPRRLRRPHARGLRRRRLRRPDRRGAVLRCAARRSATAWTTTATAWSTTSPPRPAG